MRTEGRAFRFRIGGCHGSSTADGPLTLSLWWRSHPGCVQAGSLLHKGRGNLCCLLIFSLIVLLLPSPVFAHAKSTSYSTWEIDGNRVRVTARIPWLELQRSFPSASFSSPDMLVVSSELEQKLATYLTTRLILFADSQPCQALSPGVTAIPSGDRTRIARAWNLTCPASHGFRLHNDIFFDSAPAHLHFARIHIAGAAPVEKVFSFHDREWVLPGPGEEPEGAGSHFNDYLQLGIEHILSGTDHLVFLIALLLIGGSVGQIAQLVTGFTVAHSITLALGVLNVVRPTTTAIEALIGFSIAIVALENFWLTTGEDTRRWILQILIVALAGAVAAALIGMLFVPPLALLGLGLFSVAYLLLLRDISTAYSLRWFVAFIFGLVHGFGFAGVIAEMALPPNRVAPALLGFNLGVELGQLGMVMLVWPFLRVLSEAERQLSGVLAVQLGSAVVLAVGIFWFLTRAAGG